MTHTKVYDAVVIPPEQTFGRVVFVGAVDPAVAASTTPVVAAPTTYSLKATAAIAAGSILLGGIAGWYIRGARR